MRAFLCAIPLAALRVAVAALFVAIVSLPAQAQTRDIILFADSSLKTALDEANNFFLSENAMMVVVSYGASSELARQIETGAMADVFFSADPASMNALAERKLIDPSTRADIARKPPVVYPIAILTSSTNVLASIYLQYLTSPKAAPFFEKQGFVFLP